jgi:hypothetical protein
VAPSDIERFAAYVKSIGWKVVYGVNLAHAKPEESARSVVGGVFIEALGDPALVRKWRAHP